MFWTHLYTPASAARFSGSQLTDDHSADKLHLFIETNDNSPKYFGQFRSGIIDEFNAVNGLTDQIRAFQRGAELRIAPEQFRRSTREFAVPYNQLAIAIEEPPSIGVAESRRPGSRQRVQVRRVDYVTGPEFMMLDLGTSDSVLSDQSAHEQFLLHEEVATQELTLQIATMGFFMTTDIMLNEWRANVEDERPEFTPVQRHFVTSIPGAGQYTVSRDGLARQGYQWAENDI